MSLTTALLTSFGFALAKQFAKAWLDDDWLTIVNEVLLGDMVADEAKTRFEKRLNSRKDRNEVAQIADHVVTSVSQFSRLNPEQQRTVARALVLALANTPELEREIITTRFDPKKLEALLYKNTPAVETDNMGAEKSAYERTLKETAIQLVRIASHLRNIEQPWMEQVLADHADIQDQSAAQFKILLSILQQPTDKQRKYEEKYRRLLVNELDKMDWFGVPRVDRQRSKVQTAYISLSGQKKLSKEEQARLARRAFYVADEAFAHQDDHDRYETSRMSINDVLAQGSRLVIQGHAGSGKSTLLQWLAIQTSNTRSATKLPTQLHAWRDFVPFFVQLRLYEDKEKLDFPEPADWVMPDVKKTLGNAAYVHDWVTDLADDGRALLLLDGVDELSDPRRKEFLGWLQRQLIAYPKLNIVVSSRPTAINAQRWPAWNAWITKQKWHQSDLLPMTTTQVRTFVTQWHNALHTAIKDSSDYVESDLTEVKRKKQRLNNLLKHTPELRRMAETPLLCAMICALYQDLGDSISTKRDELYIECVDMLLFRREKRREVNAKGIHYPVGLEHKTQKVLVADFAYRMMEADLSVVEQQLAIEWFDAIRESRRLTKDESHETRDNNALGLLRFFTDRTDLLRQDGNDIGFPHRTLQAFLTAFYVSKTNKFHAVVNAHAGKNTWREALILLGSIAEEDKRLTLTKLLLNKSKKTKGVLQKELILLAAIAFYDDPLEASEELVTIEEQLQLAIQIVLPPQNMDDVRLLIQIGDPVVHLLSPDQGSISSFLNSGAREHQLSALFGIGGKTAQKQIRTYITGKDNAKTLQLSHVQLSDVTQLKNFSDLQILYLNSTPITDLTPLINLTSLKRLYLGATLVMDVTPLKNLRNLEFLDLSSTQVTDITPLKSLINLQSLNLNSTMVFDLSDLRNLKKLQSLSITNTNVFDVSFLQKLTNLQELSLHWSDVYDLGPLKSLTNLQILDLSETQVLDLTPILELTKLKALDLSMTDVSETQVFRLQQILPNCSIIQNYDY